MSTYKCTMFTSRLFKVKTTYRHSTLLGSTQRAWHVLFAWISSLSLFAVLLVFYMPLCSSNPHSFSHLLGLCKQEVQMWLSVKILSSNAHFHTLYPCTPPSNFTRTHSTHSLPVRVCKRVYICTHICTGAHPQALRHWYWHSSPCMPHSKHLFMNPGSSVPAG